MNEFMYLQCLVFRYHMMHQAIRRAASVTVGKYGPGTSHVRLLINVNSVLVLVSEI